MYGTSPISPPPRRCTVPAVTTRECSPATASPRRCPGFSASCGAASLRDSPPRRCWLPACRGAARVGHRKGLNPSGAGRRRIDRGPGGAVVGGLDLECLGVGGFPVQDDLADGVGGAEVDLEPLRVTERARPAGGGVPVDGIGCRVAGAFQRGRGGGVALG